MSSLTSLFRLTDYKRAIIFLILLLTFLQILSWITQYVLGFLRGMLVILCALHMRPNILKPPMPLSNTEKRSSLDAEASKLSSLSADRHVDVRGIERM